MCFVSHFVSTPICTLILKNSQFSRRQFLFQSMELGTVVFDTKCSCATKVLLTMSQAVYLFFLQVYKKMEEHEHTNDFVTATFACDLYKMKMLIALGKRMW